MLDLNFGWLSEETITALLSRKERKNEEYIQCNLKKAAVLLPLYCGNKGWEIFFTRRTDAVQYHKGQVSFPGGFSEYGDDDAAATALRETREEIGLFPADVKVLGTMNAMPTPTGYLITPVVGRIFLSSPFNLSPAEVERVFSIPLTWLSDSKHWEERDYIRHDGSVERVVFFHEYDGEVVWGITGRIVIDFLVIMGIIK
jgi:8-oxo-dGTP pyrophosphatase MutT (NUDIX family)